MALQMGGYLLGGILGLAALLLVAWCLYAAVVLISFSLNGS
jgi:hypothetical protein